MSKAAEREKVGKQEKDKAEKKTGKPIRRGETLTKGLERRSGGTGVYKTDWTGGIRFFFLVMAENNTSVILDMLKSFDAAPLIIAFCVSIAVGLLLGATVYMILTWMSRRKAGSAIITRRPPRRSQNSPRSRPGFNRSSSSYERRSNNSLISAAFSFHRPTSSPDQLDAVGHKSSFRASTFHPLIQCSQIAREAEEGSQTTLPRTPPLTASPGSAQTASEPGVSRSRPESFWGNNGLRGLGVTQIPPPAYESIIRAYQETRT